MITLRDFEAFCEAEPNRVLELAVHYHLNMVEAYARAHEAALRSNMGEAIGNSRKRNGGVDSDHRK